MMTFESFRRPGDPNPIARESSVLIVKNDEGTPIAVFIALPHGGVLTSRIDDPDFNDVLRELGIRQVTVCGEFRQSPLEELMHAPLIR